MWMENNMCVVILHILLFYVMLFLVSFSKFDIATKFRDFRKGERG